LNAQDLFERYAQALAIRNQVFDNYFQAVEVQKYKDGLLTYLSSELVVKESRTKWQ